MFLKKIEAALDQILSFETEVKDVSFSIDGLVSFFSKRNIPNKPDTKTITVEGKLKWQITFEKENQGIAAVSASVPDNQKLLLRVSYYVDGDDEKTKEIQEEITLKNVTVKMHSERYFSTYKNTMSLNLRVDEIVWDEDGTLIEFRAG